MTPDRERTPRSLVAALMLTATLNPLNSTMVAVALPSIAAAFGVGGGTVTTWLVTSYLIVNIALVSSAGKLGDLVGRRRALRLGQGALALGAIVGGLSPVLSGVVAGRILMAAGGAVVIPAVMATLRDAIAPERRSRLFAWLGSAMGIAAAIGPVLGGVLTGRLGWQAIFLVNAPLLLIAGVLARGAPVREQPDAPRGSRSGRRLDLVGVALLVVGLGALALGLRGAAGRWVLLLAGGVSLLAFVAWERRAVEPTIDLALFREPHFVAGGVVVALQNLSMYALLFQLPFLFEGPLGLDAEQGGRVLLAMMGTMVVTAPIGGMLSERIGVRTTVLLGLVAGVGGLLVGLRAIDTQAVGPLVVCLGGMGLGVGFVMGPNQAAALSAVATHKSGMAAGVLATLRYLGGLAGVSIIAAVLHGADVAARTDPAAMLADHRRCLWLYIGAHAVAVLVAGWLPRQIEARTAPVTERAVAP